MQIPASIVKSDLACPDGFSIIRPVSQTLPLNDDKQMLRRLKYLFGAGLVLVANPNMVLADEEFKKRSGQNDQWFC